MSGTLVIIGGHEDRTGDEHILADLVERAGRGRIVVCTTASELPDESFDDYRKAFGKLGAREIVHLNVRTRAEALTDGAAEVVAKAKAVLFSGGDQLRLTSQLGDTPVFQAIHDHFVDGGVVAGTSAGASALSDTMLVSGDGEQSPKAANVEMAPGFGFVSSIVIDQHFAARGRVGRLIACVAQNPKSLGIGVDENTALVVKRLRCEVIGEGAVYVIDGSGITFSNVAEAADGELLSVHDVRIHILSPGDRFDLTHRRPVVPRSKEQNF